MPVGQGSKGAPLFRTEDMVDHFRVVRLVGRGGMGDVYLARDTRLGRKVALKVVRPGVAGTDKEVQRFLFEARTTARFSHPHIVTIYAVGLHHDHPYLALEYLDGQNLRARMSGGGLGVKASLRVVLAVAEALEEAHLHDVLHRDLKPENVIIPSDGRLRVVDFGLAEVASLEQLPTAMDLGGQKASEMNTVQLKEERRGPQGTPPYMAPEQWRGAQCTAAADIWAVGVILFEMLSGNRPYDAASVLQLAAQVVSSDPAPRLEAAEEIPRELSELVAACMNKDPAARPSATEVAAALRGILSRGQAARSVDLHPFPGLLPFNEKHAPLFHGRDEELDSFMERLRREPVLPVVGPSGAGKSSFVHAGVIPRLREQGPWRVLHLRPGADPLRALGATVEEMMRLTGEQSDALLPTHQALPTATPSSEVGPGGKTLAGVGPDSAASPPVHELLRSHPAYLSLILERLAARLRCRVLLFVDQLEELYTLGSDPEGGRAFMEAVCGAADDPLGPNRVIFTLREDFLGRVAGGAPVRAALSRVTLIRTPEPDQLRQILTRPVEALGYAYEDDGLVTEMIQAAGQEQASLPLLQFTARMLWERRDPKSQRLTRQAYEQLGGVAGALARHADGVLDALPAEEITVARDILLRLVTPQGTRRVQTWDDVLDGLPATSEGLVDRLVQARLISVRKSRLGDEDTAEVELVHESLINTWGRLSRWIHRSREELAFLDEVEQAARLWSRRGLRYEEVWSGAALADAGRALARCQAPVPEPVRNFIAAGQRKERRRVRTRRILMALGALLVAGVMLVLLHQRDLADAQRGEARKQLAEARREGARAALMRGDLFEARAKLRGALETQDSAPARVLWWRVSQDQLVWRKRLGSMIYSVAYAPDGKLIAAVGKDKVIYLIDPVTRQTRATIRGEWDQILSVAFSPGSRKLAIGTWSGDIFIRDLEGGSSLPLRGHKNAVYGLAYSPDGKWLASGGMDRAVRLWDLSEPGTSQVLPGGERPASTYQVAFRPDGKQLAGAGEDGVVRLWDLEGARAQLHELRGHRGLVFGVDYSPDGLRLASASFDLTIHLWRVGRHKPERIITGIRRPLLGVKFSPDGQHLASSGYDGVIRTWAVASGRQVATYDGHDEKAEGLAYSPDGRFLVSGSRDRTVRLWAVMASRPGISNRGHTGPVYGLAFSPDGQRLASSGWDGRIRVWSRASGREVMVLDGHTARVRMIVFSPDGGQIASVGYDNVVRLWELTRRGGSRVLSGVASQMEAVRFSPNGKLLATGSGDAAVRLWDVDNQTLVMMIKGDRAHQDRIKDLAFSPDGRRLASSSRDGTVRIWSVPHGQALSTLEGHQGAVNGIAFLGDGARLVSAGSDGTVRLWDLGGGTNRILEQRAARAYKISLLGAREQVAVAWSDRRVSVVPLGVGQVRRLVGHHSEVNTVAASADGAFLASAGDDATVRLWRTDKWAPYWRIVALLTRPPRVLSHVGWSSPGQASGAVKAPPGKWASSLATTARLAKQSADGKRLCVAGSDGTLELWDLDRDRRVFNVTLGQVKQVETTASGCLVLAQGEARLVDARGQVQSLTRDAGAVSWVGNHALVAGDTQVNLYDGAGKLLRSWSSGPGVTALTRVEGRLALGFRDGNIELLRDARSPGNNKLTFEDVPASKVVRLLAGPKGTLVAGFANGQLGIWSLDNGARLRRSRLHGAVRHIALAGGKLLAATELGDHLSLDLSTFDLAYCDLMRRVWKEVPVMWENGMPIKREPVKGHRCK